MVTRPDWPQLAQGQNSKNVKALQHLLVYRGYSISTDGIFGSGTRTAVVNFQTSRGLSADGVAGANTLSALITNVSNGSNGQAAYAAQTLLSKFETLDVDGMFYGGSASAARTFQQKMGISVDGIVGPTTWQYLFGYNTYPAGTGGGETGGSDVTGDYITAGVGGWLKLYKNPTSNKVGRTVSIPSVASFVGADGYSYQFTNRNYWYAWENPYGSNRINPYAISRIRAVTGSNPIINVGSNGEYTDENGNYWMAVGPKVPHPSQAANANILPENMYGLGKLDVVVKNAAGTRYYIPGVIGDIKAHTHSNGVIQTFKAYPNGAFSSAGGNFNGTVCAEFIGSLSGKLSGLGNYSVEKMIFYAD